MAEIKLKIASVVIGSGEGGGSGVAPYYADLPDKPSINGETLSGDMTSEDLGLASESQAVPSGGTTGQVLAKKSNADNDVQWVNQESGGQGTTDYSDLDNKPKINNVTLFGNKTAAQLGLQAELVSGTNIKTINNQSIVGSGNITIEGGGTDDYADLDNKPQINSVALSGNKSASDLGLATAAQGMKADTAVQQVTVGTTTTGNAGTDASVTNSGTATAPVLTFTIPRGADGADGADAVNPFKGWWPDLATLKAAHTAIAGDSAYVKDASPATTWSIYVYNSTASSDEYWADSGLNADTSNVQTFASGEEVNETNIDDTHLNNPLVGAIALAGDVKQKIESLENHTITDAARDLIVTLFRKCLYSDDNAETYISELEEELTSAKTVLSIVAVFTQGQNVVYRHKGLEQLRQYLVVTANYDDGTSENVAGYTLSGELTEGLSTVTVTYKGVNKTFTVDVSVLRITFASSEILVHYAPDIRYSVSGVSQHYTQSRNDRAGYTSFDKLFEGGYSVKVTSTCNKSGGKFGLQMFTTSALSKVSNQTKLIAGIPDSPSVDIYDTGWITAGVDTTITVPYKSTSSNESVIAGSRISAAMANGSDTVPDDFELSITLEFL